MFSSNYSKKKAIKSYIYQLGKDLAKRYGKSAKYSSGQVEKTIHEEGYNWKHICYAHALYTSMKQFNQWHYDKGESCDYDAMREEISVSFLGGDISALDANNFTSDTFDSAVGDGGGSD